MTIEWFVMNSGKTKSKWDLCEKFTYYNSLFYPYLEYNGKRATEEDILEYMFREFEEYVYENELDIDCNNIDYLDE